MSSATTTTRNGEIPAAPIQRILKAEIARIARDYAFDTQSPNSMPVLSPYDPTTQVALQIWRDGDPVNVRSRLDNIVKRQTTISFDLADRILARLHMTMLWRTDPELSEIYESFNMLGLDLTSPTCDVAAGKLLSTFRAIAEQRSIAEAGRHFGVGPHISTRVYQEALGFAA